MKYLSLVTLLAILAMRYELAAAEQTPGPQPPPDQVSTNAVKAAEPSKASEAAPAPAGQVQPAPTSPEKAPPGQTEPGKDDSVPAASEASETQGLLMNFHNASLDQVLTYLSEAAGFIIVVEAQPRGKVDVYANKPLSRDEAADLLDSVLKRNGLAAVHEGRKLTIVNRDEVKTRGIPVRLGADPESIPQNDEIVTQIIPVRFVEVAQLIKDLQPLVSTTSTTMTANESGNSIVITDTQANIHKVAEVIKAIDSGAEDVTLVRVFRLKNADPSETTDLLTNLFPDDSRTGSGNQAPIQFGGRGGFARFFGGGGAPGGGNAAGNGQNQRLQKRHRVIAVAEPRTSSVVVSAARDLMEQIEEVIQELDGSSARKQTVHVYRLDNAEPSQAMQVLQDIFQKNNQQNTRNTTLQNNPLLTRSTTQNQQNTTSRNSALQGGRGIGGAGGFGQ